MDDDHAELVYLALDVARLRAALDELQHHVDDGLRELSAEIDRLEERARRLAGLQRIDVAAAADAAEAFLSPEDG